MPMMKFEMLYIYGMAKTVLISPLDWGLGHATRIVPIVEYYQRTGWKVVIGTNGNAATWLKNRFPSVLVEFIPGYEVRYSKRLNFALKMLLSLPSIYKGIQREKKRVKQLHLIHQFDVVISDNRFGVRVKGVKNYFITHQLNIRFPYFEKQIFRVQKKLIAQFDACFIPDFPIKENLAGELSVLKKDQKLGVPFYYIGALSRFYNSEVPQLPIKYDLLAIVSGPEPHKTSLTNLIIKEFADKKEQVALVTYDFKAKLPENIHLFLDCSDDQFLNLVGQSDVIISRSGYTTIMDLAFLRKKAFFIPTPGQTEQLYLAEYAAKNGWADYCIQEEFKFDKITKQSKGFPFGKSPLNVVLENLTSEN